MEQLTTLFKALSEPARLRILNLILEAGQLCVCDLQRILGFTQTKVSRHLAYLKHSGILRDRREGAWVVYSLAGTDDPVMSTLFREIQDLFATEQTLQKDIAALRAAVRAGKCVSLCVLPEVKSSRPQ